MRLQDKGNMFAIRSRRPGLGFVLFCCLWVLRAAAAVESPQRGGVLHVAQRAEIKTFNPVIAIDAPSREVLRRMHADLISIDRATQKTVPSLAQSWTHSPDGKKYTIKLRPALRFSDGQPFTADDVVFSWNLYLDEANHSPQRDLLMIDGQPIEAVKIDGLTVEFRLPKPYAAAERLFDSVAMLPRHKLESARVAGKIAQAWPVSVSPSEVASLGPFRLKEYLPGEAVLLERNPYYWQAGLPYLDGIEFRLLADEDVQLARFATGDLDILNRLGTKSVRFLEERGATVADLGPSLEYNFLCFNLSDASPKLAWFGSREFRQAISLAVDRNAIVRVVYGGRGTPLWGPVSPGDRLWYSDRIPKPPVLVPQAQNLLRKAGFRWNGAGRLQDASGKPVEFSILVSTSSPERVQMATLLQADLDQIGIKITIAAMEFRSALDRVLNTRQFDTVLLGLGGGDPDPNSEMNVWLSSGGTHLWNPNQKHPATPWEAEIDDRMNRQMVTLDPVERKKQYDRVQEILAIESPMVFLASPHVVVAARGNVGNFHPAVLDHFTLWNSATLFLRRGPAK